MARNLGDLDWDAPHAALGNLTLRQWAIARRSDGYSTTAEIARDASNLTGEDVSAGKVNSVLQKAGVTLTPEQVRESYVGRQAGRATPRYDNPPKVMGDALILNDVQVPFHDWAFMQRCVRLAETWHIPNLILGGDFADVHALNSFGSRADLNLDEEIDQIENVLSYLRKRFRSVLWLMGNHEQRIERFLNGKGDIWTILRQFRESVETAYYYYCDLNDDWIVTHPKNTSIHGGLVPAKLALREKKHVASGHGHLLGIRYADDGEHLGVDTGVVADPLKLSYYALRHSTRPTMNQGALIVRSGFPTLLTPGFPTDWRMLEVRGTNGFEWEGVGT